MFEDRAFTWFEADQLRTSENLWSVRPSEIHLKFDEIDLGTYQVGGLLALLDLNVRIRRSTMRFRKLFRQWQLGYRATVPDRFTGRPIPIQFGVSVHEELLRDMKHKDAYDYLIRGPLCSAMTHEVDESISQNGQLVFDPHAGEHTV